MSTYSTISDTEKHSAAHVLAMAVSRKFPHVKIGIGPVTKQGFYYDFDIQEDLDTALTQEIESEIKKIIEEDLPFQQITIARNEAVNLMLQKGQIYKAELINNIPDAEISFFKTGDEFIDLCRGPHVNSTKELGPMKITSIENVNWNYDEKRPKLKRISGMVFRNQEELEQYIRAEEEKGSRDYVKIATIKNYGFVNNSKFYLSLNGSKVIENIYKTISKELTDEGFHYINLSHKANDIQEISEIIDMIVFQKEPSYKKIPLNILTKYISSSTPLKDSTQESEVLLIKKYIRQSEVIFHMNIILDFIKIFNNIKGEFTTDIEYKNAEDSLFNQVSSFLQRNLISHNKVITQAENIKLQIKCKDDLDRDWVFAELKINGAEFTKKINFVNKESDLGYLEFTVYPMNILAYYLENAEADFPEKLMPYEFVLIPVSKKFELHAQEVQRKINKMGLNSEIALGNKSFKSKIRRYEMNKTPIILIIGPKEIENNGVSLRHNGRDEGLIAIENLKSYVESNIYNS